MRFVLDINHQNFFLKHRYIEFEALLSLEQIALLQQEIDQTIAKRFTKLSDGSSKDIFQAGYDLWRDNQVIKKIAFKNQFAEIASILFSTDPIRIAFDQYLATSPGSHQPFTEGLTLTQTSCAKPLAGALLLRLSEEPLVLPYEQPLCPIPKQIGNVLFLSPLLPIHWNLLFSLQNTHLFLIAYAPKRALYHLEKQDPHTHAWKRLGYVFGDALTDSLHPILHR
jgi:hypothetical protein